MNTVRAGRWLALFLFAHILPDTVRTPADIVAWYEERFAPAMERLKETHTIHHRGQVSTYLRPMGGKVPSIYGESYDAREARERAGLRRRPSSPDAP